MHRGGLARGSLGSSEMSEGSKSQEAAGGSHMALGVMSAIRPAIQRFDAQVLSARESQVFLAARIQELCDFLHVINQEQPYELDSYSRKLNDSTKRVTSTYRVLENVQARLIRLQREIARDVDVKKEGANNTSSTFSSH
ncbi:hypothetical protein KIN20_021614 [Parelaphostrongylus tenuis]|uniref:Biogenesis of lysosome-related organelles complex 1 subunit 7 n=1 Tax=Parelaphostrongylus tenuis TaxID=148309 RepID=A0AAD5MUH6_PARTN|nr:hypothetical protein KIN20_018875 [Parelaphostrongylus tenuis]KAJ1362178.1 hypothetical protein KIN20_021614 [Parelaphostrongylus tenuis]